MNIRFCAIAMALIALLAGIPGCITSAPTTLEKQGDTYRVTENSFVLRNNIKIVERSVRRTADNLLEAQVRGQNVTRKDVQFEYRFVWIDADGMRIDTAMSVWKPLNLHAKEAAFMRAIAPTPDATDFLMSVRFVHTASRWQEKRR